MKQGIRAKQSFKQYMKDNDIKNIDIADITGLTETTVSKFVKCHSCSMGTAVLIARELEINVDDIIEKVKH